MSPVVRSAHSQLALAARADRARVYRDPRWRGPGGTRARTLDRAYGQCEYPIDDWNRKCCEPATIADHWPTPLAQVLAQGGDPYDDANTRALCAHHSGKADGGRS